ncbi:MAG: hypothetical protein AAGC56_12965 [Pseudomonadota bacterium]
MIDARVQPARSPRALSIEAGFSLIEGLVALALVSVAFLPLLALQSRLAETAAAVKRAETLVTVYENAIARLERVNPTVFPEGREEFADAVMTWTARPASVEKRVRDQAGNEGRFEAQLFVVDVQIMFDDGRTANFQMKKMGWQAVEPLLQ